MSPLPHQRRTRRLALAALVLLVLAVHGGLGRWLALPGLGGDSTPPLRRMEVAFVQELQPAAPPVVVTAVAPRAVTAARALVAPLPAAAPASAPTDPQTAPALDIPSGIPPDIPAQAVSATDPAVADPAVADPAVADAFAALPAPSDEDLAPVAPEPAPGMAAADAVFPGPEWPLSTRLSYVLTGHFRGPVDGQARVDWLRQGTRYQVHLELSVGPFFAPLASRRLSSEGEITPQGLRPLRYEEETRIAFRDPRRLRIDLDGSQLRLPSGRTLPRPEGVQDSASQFVHMTWLFTLQPQRLQAGQSVALPLALPRTVEPWVYDVVGPDTLFTPMGELPVVHVRPRRDTSRAALQGGDLTAEFWVAPTLQYLPARILIRQSDEVWIDLRLDRLPQQAAAPR